jgi:type VI secretion system secreted protein VgrG
MHKLLRGASDQTIHQLIDPVQSDYRAAVYRDEKTRRLFVACRGTHGSREDWFNNISQSRGARAEYHSKAIAPAQLLKQSPEVQGYGIEFTGHSLGGGLAATAALEARGPEPSSAPPRRWKCSAMTFNPAGVHLDTATGRDFRSAVGYIDAYVLENEPLNASQDNRSWIDAGVTGITLAVEPERLAGPGDGLSLKYSVTRQV